MKQKHTPTHLLLASFLSGLLSLAGCSSAPIVSQNIKVDATEEQKLSQETERISSANRLSVPINQFVFPTDAALMQEAGVKDVKVFNQNVRVLSDWIQKNLSARQKYQLNKNCQALVGSFSTKFPLDDTTIACAAWWIEKQNALYLDAQKTASSLENPTPKLSERQRKDWASYQDLSIAQAIPLIDVDNAKKQKYFIDKALLYAENCSLKNANAALIFKLENALPNKEIYNSMEQIYAKMEKCLVPNEEPAEKIHLRMGLLRLLQGRSELAYEALQKTQLESNPKENSRNLFWLGAIYQKKNPLEKNNPYWNQLTKENPLSLASLVAMQQMNKDPMTLLVSDSQIMLQDRVEDGWNKENLESFVFELLLAKNQPNAVYAWTNYVAKYMTSSNTNLLLYWAYSQNQMHHYFNSIQMLSKYFRYQKSYIASPMLVKLLFPTPYLPELTQIKSQVDPVFILALMRQESAFDELARSGANARGLMQILPVTAQKMKRSVRPRDLFDPDTNIAVGSVYLEKLFKKYEGKSEYVLAAYNAGPNNVDKWLNRVPSDNTMLFCDFIPYRETRNYISIIFRNYYWYSRLISMENSKLTQTIQNRSLISQYKPKRVEALLDFSSKEKILSDEQKQLLDKIYIFGSENHMSVLKRFSSPKKTSIVLN